MLKTPAPTLEEHTCESLVLGGRLRLLQPAQGYRAGMDAALLAAAVKAEPGMRLIEAGCGAGGALLQAAARRPQARFLGVERDEAALDLARRNIALNGMQDRVEARAGDVQGSAAGLGREGFDAAFANPPFFDDPSRLRAPAAAKRGAYFADGGLEAWTGFLLDAVRSSGAVTVIHRADRLHDLLALLSAKAGSFQVRPVHSFAEGPAKRVVVTARKGGRAPLTLLAPLVMHQRDASGAATSAPAAEAILRGEAELSWA
jgi:tRNA1(Val) A37 N6-methylase TrmN6